MRIVLFRFIYILCDARNAGAYVFIPVIWFVVRVPLYVAMTDEVPASSILLPIETVCVCVCMSGCV